jgi:chemosensory pili system protein ChpA (sensor histidine kinase/response regulator)
MAGYTSIGDLSHSLESLILAVLDAGLEPNTDLFELVQQSLDRLHSMHHNVAKAEPVYPASDLLKALNEFIADKPVALSQRELKSSRPLTDIEAHSAVPSDSNNSTQLLPDGVDTIQNIPESLQSGNQALIPSERKSGINIKPLESASTQELIRVRSELIDVLVNNAGEVNIYHARFGQQISAFSYNLGELEQTVARLRNQLRDLEMETEAQILFRYEQEKKDLEEEFDPLELDRYSTIQQLSRALSESVSDLVSIQEILVNLVRDSEMLLMQQSRVSTNLQEGLMRSRMVKFGSLAPRLSRIARQTARELGKKVKLHLIGETNELDRSVLDRMVAPLEHMLRNSISHGIDLPENRIKYSKPEVGTVRVSVARDGSEVVIQVEDDGMGVNLKAVRETARRQGLLGPEDELSDHQIIQFILEPGFSTAREITQISGRGVGMDVVNNEIRQLGGVLSIDSEQGKGTAFTIRLPFTLAISQALLVLSGEDQYAVPLTSIEGIVRLSAAELKEKYAMPNPTYEYVDNVYKLKHLGALLGMSRPVLNDQITMMPVLLVKSGEHRVALQTEGLAGSREIVVKPVGPQISKVRGVSGATILGDGRVVLILDVAGLIRLAATVQSMASTEELEPPVVDEQMTTVMVVDDSITIRKVTSRMLERNKYAVITAKDGVDALSQLQELKPDLFLLDIEMPRMDGYELATHIRNNDRLKEIPIIMITSRTGEKHRQRALGIGVNKYLGKPYQETDLLENIKEMLGH